MKKEIFIQLLTELTLLNDELNIIYDYYEDEYVWIIKYSDGSVDGIFTYPLWEKTTHVIFRKSIKTPILINCELDIDKYSNYTSYYDLCDRIYILKSTIIKPHNFLFICSYVYTKESVPEHWLDNKLHTMDNLQSDWLLR